MSVKILVADTKPAVTYDMIHMTKLEIIQSVAAYMIDGLIENNKTMTQKFERLDTRLYNNEIMINEIRRFANEKHGASPSKMEVQR